MEKGRARKLGEALGVVVDVVISAVPEMERQQYSERFFRELGNVCLLPRKQGEPPLEGVNELEGLEIDDLDLINQPENFARIVKEAAQIGYNWRTKRNILTGVHDHHDMEPNFIQDR